MLFFSFLLLLLLLFLLLLFLCSRYFYYVAFILRSCMGANDKWRRIRQCQNQTVTKQFVVFIECSNLPIFVYIRIKFLHTYIRTCTHISINKHTHYDSFIWMCRYMYVYVFTLSFLEFCCLKHCNMLHCLTRIYIHTYMHIHT